MWLSRLAAVVVVPLLALACGTGREKQAEAPIPEHTPFEEAAIFGEVIPLADGSAYIRSSDNIYYVAAARAQRVEGVGDSGGDIVALADGTALLTSSLLSEKPVLYWLKGPNAFAVQEGAVEVSGLRPVEAWFTQVNRLRGQLHEAEYEVARLEEGPDPGPDEEQEYIGR